MATKSIMFKILFILALLFTTSSFVHSTELVDGYYNEYYLGSKSGGPWFHDDLAKQLMVITKGKSLSVLCIKGPDSTTAIVIDVKEYRKNNPKVEVLNKCKGSGWVYVGPYSSYKLAKHELNYYSRAMLHTIPSEVLNCKSLTCKVINEEPNK